jgi:MYXO-CTERM domain-containing protein
MPFVVAQAVLEKAALEGLLSDVLGRMQNVAFAVQERPWLWIVLALVLILLIRRRR